MTSSRNLTNVMTRTVTPEVIAFIKQWEGVRLEAYKCPAGVWTIGYGHTRTARQGLRITQQQADALLVEDLRKFERAVDDAVHVDLTDNQFGALVSWAFNVGEAAMRKSTLVRKLNAGDYDSVPSELARWNKAGGKVVRGLTNRRAAEAGLWARGAFVAGREVVASDGLSAKEAATATGTGKAAIGVGTAGVLSTVAQHSEALSVLGVLGPAVGIALIVAAVVLFVLWRKGKL